MVKLLLKLCYFMNIIKTTIPRALGLIYNIEKMLSVRDRALLKFKQLNCERYYVFYKNLRNQNITDELKLK